MRAYYGKKVIRHLLLSGSRPGSPTRSERKQARAQGEILWTR
jgi:hypothetical protein